MRKIQIAISSDLCIRLTWDLTDRCGQQRRLRGWSRMVVKQFQDGERSPFWKSICRHISVKNHPISMKFCTQEQILNWMNVTWSKMKKLHWRDSVFDRTYFLLFKMVKSSCWWRWLMQIVSWCEDRTEICLTTIYYTAVLSRCVCVCMEAVLS